jgi:hypothetical protein
MMNLNSLNFYIIVPSTIFFYCLFQGYFSIRNIKNLLYSYPLISTLFNFFVSLFLICLLLYLFSDTVYAMAPEGYNFPNSEVKLTTGDVSNSVHIKDSNINIPNTVATGLTNLGTGAAIAAGLKGGASIAKASGLSPGAKIGVMAAGAIIGGATVTVVNAVGSISQKKTDNAVTSVGKSNPTIPPTSNPGSGNGGVAFSIEPNADLDTVINLLDANLILHICILYLPIALMILYISTMIVENK